MVYGFWGLVALVPLIGRLHPPGPSLLAGVLILTVMILPTIALMADAALEAVPEAYLRGAAALGLSRWATVRGVVLPAARSGLFTGTIVETGRAIGETMAVLMVCGNVVQTPGSLFDPVRTLTANIALEMAYALGDHRSALFVSGLLLLVTIVALAIVADQLAERGRRRDRTSTLFRVLLPAALPGLMVGLVLGLGRAPLRREDRLRRRDARHPGSTC